MTEIEELLAQLKELDPETYRDFREICAMTAFDSSDLDDPNITTPVYGWCLQGLILEAIGARGWIFSLDRVDGHYTAYIWDERDRGLSADSCDTPAEVILAAYIAAREAEREAGE